MTCLEAIRMGLGIVRDALSSMEEDVLSAEYGPEWWDQAVLRPMEEDGKRPYGWPDQGDAGDLDLQTALKLVSVYHWDLFSDNWDWGGKERGLLQAMIAIRNQYEGHVTPNREKELTPAVTDEILEGMARFLRLFDRPAARRIEAIEVPREEETPGIGFAEEEAPPPEEPRPAPPPKKPALTIVPETKKEEPAPEDRPLTPEERKIVEESGYRSLWDEEDEQPVSFYSRKPSPPPEPQPKIRPVLYQGVRVEEEPRRQESPKSGRAVNLQDLRRTKPERPERREQPPREDDRLQGMPRIEERPEDVADPEPFPVQGSRRGSAASGSAGTARRPKPVQISGRPWWEEKREAAPEPLRRREVMEQVHPAPVKKSEKEALLTRRQQWILALWIILGTAVGIGILVLDLYLKQLQAG